MSRNISKEPEKDDKKYDEKDLEKDDELEYIETRPRVYCAEVSLPDDNRSVREPFKNVLADFVR